MRYDLLATLLLNEFQKDHRRVRALEKAEASLAQQAQELAQLKEQVAAMAALVRQTQRPELVAAAQ